MGSEMKKNNRFLGWIAGSAILLFAVAANAGGNAEVATDQFCRCSTCGNALGSSPLQTYNAKLVKAASGNVTFQCHFDIPKGYEPTSAMQPGSPGCMTRYGLSNKTHILLSPGGNAVLTCQVSRSGR